jgi:hypothetical protein
VNAGFTLVECNREIMEYDRHRLTRDGINAKNNIAKMHVDILELDAAKRRAESSTE